MKLESSLRDHAAYLYTVPLLDMVLLLLIFFLLGSTLILKSGISVNVPVSMASLPSVDTAHVITVLPGQRPQIYFDENRISLEELPEYLEKAAPTGRQVIIRADRFSSFGFVVEISNMVLSRGFDLAYATRSE